MGVAEEEEAATTRGGTSDGQRNTDMAAIKEFVFNVVVVVGEVEASGDNIAGRDSGWSGLQGYVCSRSSRSRFDALLLLPLLWMPHLKFLFLSLNYSLEFIFPLL